MNLPIPASLHRALYRVAYRVRGWMRRTLRLPIHGVGAILRDGEGRILMVRHSYGAPGWTLPGGGHARREDPEQAVRRELREELGIEIDALELIATLEERLSGAPHKASLFAGIALGEPRPDGREVIAARFFASGEIPEGLSAPTRLRLDIWLTHVSARVAADHSKGS